jgi:hypothetical protein
MFGMFFFLTIFVQTVWGFSPVKSGLSYLPMVAAIMAASGIASQLVSRIGARPLMIGGAALMAGGMFWMSQLTEHSTYTGSSCRCRWWRWPAWGTPTWARRRRW